MSIKIKNLRISPYSQKDDLKVIFGDQMTVTFEIEHVAGESYACALDNERILYPPNRPVCAYTEAFTRDGDNVTFTLDLRTSKLRDFVSSIRKPMPIWLQVVRGVNGKYETVVLDDVLALPSVIDGSMTVYDGDPIKSLIDAKMDTPQAEGTEGQVLTMDADGHYAWQDLPEQEQTDWDESSSTSPAYLKNRPDLSVYVEKENGKGLSTNDFTDAEKEKLEGIEAGAQANVKPDWNADESDSDGILNKPTIPTKTSDLTNDSDFQNGTQVSTTISTAISGKADKSELPTKTSDLTNDSDFQTGTEVSTAISTAIADKADKATTLAGYGITNAYTKNEVDSKVASVYRYKGTVQTYADLPSTDQEVGDVYNVVTADTTHGVKAGDNLAWTGSSWDVLAGEIDLSAYATKAELATVATSGSYNDLSNKPTIPAAQIQSDWEQSDSLAVDFIKGKPFVDNTPYLAFTIASIDTDVPYPYFGLVAYGSPNAVTLETSTDKKTWASYTISGNMGGNMAAGLTVGDTIYVRGDNATFSTNYDAFWYFAANGMELEASGDCMSLLSKDFSVKEIPEYGFNSLFEYGSGGINNWLLSVPDVNAEAVNYRSCRQMFKNCKKIRKPMAVLPAMQFKGNDVYRNMFNSSGLETAPVLPCMNLTSHCYGGMFQNSALLVAPELPATEIPQDSDGGATYNPPYDYMFASCKNLIKAPSVLPALTLYGESYYYMFSDCYSLEMAPQIMATSSAMRSMAYMFNNCQALTKVFALQLTSIGYSSCECMYRYCTSLNYVPAFAATSVGVYGCANMFIGCRNLKQAPSLNSVTSISYGCYSSMFKDCVLLETAPSLPATTLATMCYSSMFSGCSNLKNPPSELPAATVPTQAYQYMFANCRSLKTAPAMSNVTTVYSQGMNSMFQYCTSLESAPSLPATALGEEAYGGMFGDCKALKKMPSLPATTLASRCYQWMFSASGVEYCENLPATTLANNCYQSMFENCQSLTATGNIRATTFASQAMRDMFKNCSNLRRIKVAFESWDTSVTYWWVSGVGNYGAFIAPSTLAQNYGVSNAPSGWTFATVGVDAGETKKSWYLTNIADYVIQPEASEVDRLIIYDGATTVIKASMGGWKNATTQVGYAEVIIDLYAGGTVTEGTNIEFVDTFEAGYRHICVVRWYDYDTARLYIVDKIALS